MRRIYKPNSVTTSDDFFLLGSNVDDNSSIEEDDLDESLVYNDENVMEFQSSENSDDNSSQSQLTSDKHSSQRHNKRTVMQDIAQLQELRDQMIAKATSEATRLIEEGHAKAQTEYQSAIDRATQQIENERKLARQQGRKEAFEQQSQEIVGCIKEIENTLARIEGAQAGFITGYENDLKWMALEIAQKILMDTITADETRLVPLVMTAVNSAKNEPWISVEISESMTKLLACLQKEIQDNDLDGKVNLKLVDNPPDTCIIETPDKFFDASISQQIENLKGYFAAEQG